MPSLMVLVVSRRGGRGGGGRGGSLSIMDQIGFEVPDQYIPLQVNGSLNGFGENSPHGSTHQQCEWPIV